MTKLTVLHFASPYAISSFVPKPRFEIPQAESPADATPAVSEIAGSADKASGASSGADRVSILAGDAAPSPSQAASGVSRHDTVLQLYRDLGEQEAASAGKSSAGNGSDFAP